MFFNDISFKALSTVACLSLRYCRDLIYLGLLTFKGPKATYARANEYHLLIYSTGISVNSHTNGRY